MRMLLCCILSTAIFCTGCSSRNTAPISGEPLPSEPIISEAPVIEPEPISSQAPAEIPDEFPAPDLTDMERQLVDEDVKQFIKYFNGLQKSASAAELNGEDVLAFCLKQIDRQKDMQGYLFDQDEDGSLYIPEDLVSDMALRMFGLQNFSNASAKSYIEDEKAYRYSGEDNSTEPDYKQIELKGAPDGDVAYDVQFADGSTRYRFKLLRLNGMPYLQLVSITPTP